jgi:hypothetical protein
VRGSELIAGLGDRRPAAEDEIVASMPGYEHDGQVVMPGEIVVATGTRSPQ